MEHRWCPVAAAFLLSSGSVFIVEEVLPNPAEREQVLWKTSNSVFRLGLVDPNLVTPAIHEFAVA